MTVLFRPRCGHVKDMKQQHVTWFALLITHTQLSLNTGLIIVIRLVWSWAVIVEAEAASS